MHTKISQKEKMANLKNNQNLQGSEETLSLLTFTEFPEDVQLCILSFLSPSEISSFSCTSKRFAYLCRSDSNLWFSMCERRWGSKTQIRKWGNKSQIRYRFLYKTLEKWENLIGFWRRMDLHGSSGNASPPLVFFEWGSSFITGSRVSPSKTGSYRVVKMPFIWMGVSPRGELISLVDPESRFESSGDFVRAAKLGFPDSELIPVSVGFVGKNHLVVEENLYYGFRRSSSYGEICGEDLVTTEDVTGIESSLSSSPGSLPDRMMSEIYTYFANRTSPSGDRGSRRQRKKEKERQGRRKLDAEHFMKIENCAPTPSRPLQGLWKGICDDMSLDFYLVSYDDLGGIICRRVGDSSEPFPGYSPVFWTSDTTFVESPFSSEEDDLYDSRVHLRPIAENCTRGYFPIENEVVSRILYINSSYDLVIPDCTGPSANSRQVEGRIWQYKNGTFGFGFLRNNFVLDLKHIALNGFLLDTMEYCEN